MTGAVDLVTDGESVLRIKNGDPMMALVTGTGCTASAVVGAFCAVDKEPHNAAACGLSFLGLAGELAAEKAQGPGGYQAALLDALYIINPEMLGVGARISREP
jgi:hydroxyethylthiazole kinase